MYADTGVRRGTPDSLGAHSRRRTSREFGHCGLILLGLLASAGCCHDRGVLDPSPTQLSDEQRTVVTIAQATASNQHAAVDENCLAGLPIAVQGSHHGRVELVFRSGYVLAHSERHKVALWVAEHVDRSRLAGSAMVSFVSRAFGNEFTEDPALTGAHAVWEDYADACFDPGHLAAAGNIVNKSPEFKKMRRETFYLSNNAPMIRAFNRGIWVRLEKAVREVVRDFGEAWVISGPIFADSTEIEPTQGTSVEHLAVGPGRVSVPTHFFKVVGWRNPEGRIEAVSFLFDHAESDRELRSHASRLALIQKLSGWEFFPDAEGAVLQGGAQFWAVLDR